MEKIIMTKEEYGVIFCLKGITLRDVIKTGEDRYEGYIEYNRLTIRKDDLEIDIYKDKNLFGEDKYIVDTNNSCKQLSKDELIKMLEIED